MIPQASPGNPPRPTLTLRPRARGVSASEAADILSGAVDLSAAPMGALFGKSGLVVERLKHRRPVRTIIAGR